MLQTDEWNTYHRAEGPLNRADRNFGELLQELRVVLTGVQILFGFLLTLSFSERSTHLDEVQRWLFVATLASVALSSLLLLAPVAAHRVLFRRHRKRELVRAGHRLTLAGLACLAVTLTTGVALVLEIAVGRIAAVAAGSAMMALAAVLWVGLPLWLGRRAGADPDLPEPADRPDQAVTPPR